MARQKNKFSKQLARTKRFKKPQKSSARNRNKLLRKRKKTGLLSFFTSASTRAHQRSNQRNWHSRGLKSINASIAQESDENYDLPFLHLILRSILGTILIFPCFISTAAIFEVTPLPSNSYSFWHLLYHVDAFLYFTVGSFLMLGWFWTKLLRKKFLYLYVLGHELTHAFFIFICGGKISGFKVTHNGGYVITNKSNVLIALSPYFVPFWSCVALAISYLTRFFIEIPIHNEILYFLIGFTWTFHLAWTIWMIPRDQPDLKENGSFFSLTVIYLANVLLLATLLCLSHPGITFKSYCYQWINLCIENSLSLISFFKGL